MSEVKRYIDLGEPASMAEYSAGIWVKAEDYDDLKAERDKLLAQCAELRAVQEAQIHEWKAQGVEMFAAWASQQEQFARESRDAGSALINRNCEARAKSFAASLRKGESHE